MLGNPEKHISLNSVSQINLVMAASPAVVAASMVA